MIISAAASIELHKQQINELNVFPVPDGDTGTNMSLTMGAAASDLRKADDSITIGEAAKKTASALLRGARGNSGVITSLLFRGISKSLKDKTEADGYALAMALNDGVEAAYKAVMKPTEGTILTVSRVSAAHAMDMALENPCAETVLEETIKAGYLALEETIHQNPVLEKAGVVDAGGKGYLHILEGMLAALRGEDITAPEAVEEAPVVNDKADFAAFSADEITFAFDTVYIVRKFQEDVDLDPLRAYLNSIGDSLVIGEDDESFKVHVHTNTPGDALNESQKYGTLELAKIENMRTQAEDLAAGRQAQSTDDLAAIEAQLEAQEAQEVPAGPAPAEKKYGVVSVCAGDGLAAVFRDLGVDGIIQGGQTMNPCTDDILREINKTPAEIVFVLPNNKNIVMAAQQAAPLTDKQVVVIPTATVPQGITAMLNLDPDADVAANEAAMLEAIERVTTMQITYAARDSDFDGYAIHEGDYMALVGSSLHTVSTEMHDLFRGLAGKINELDAQFVTIFYGCDVSEERAEECAAMFTELCPNAEVTLLNGGQPVYYYLISAES
jgi:hypothetical protein